MKTNFLNVRDSIRLLIGLVQARSLIKKIKPDSILLKGGFVCVPVAMAAKKHAVPYITHDSDALPGLSNRIAARWARYHATALPAKYYSYPERSVRVVGVPTDNRFKTYSKAEQAILRAKYGIQPNQQVLLITGGSNGARRMNQGLLTLLPELLNKNPNLYVLHQIGAGNEDQIAEFPADLTKRADFFAFTSELFHMSAIADAVITRAGASILADLGVQKKACIVIPNPFLTGGHQLKNARVYNDAKAAVIIDEATLADDPAFTLNTISEVLNNSEKQAELSKNLYDLTPKNAAGKIADLLVKVAK